MRIVHVSDCYLPRLGGIEVQVAELAAVQQAAGHDVAVVTATPGDPAESRGPAVHRVAVRLPWQLPLHPRAGGHVAALAATLKPDVVHVHVGAISPFAWAAARQVTRAGLPTVVTVHSMWGPLTRGVYRLLDSAAGWRRWRLVVTAVSRAAAEPVRVLVGDRLPIQVVANGIDVARWRVPPRIQGAASDTADVHVVTVGRLAPRKQPLELVRMLDAARSRLPAGTGLRATIVGDGPLLATVERFLRRQGMSGWVRLAGRLDRAAVREVLATADVFVAPARRESFGLAALEARCAGVPVVARARSGVADFVRHGVEGLLGESHSELVAAVARLAGDHALRRRIAEHNRATEPRGCAWPEVVAEFARCYGLA